MQFQCTLTIINPSYNILIFQRFSQLTMDTVQKPMKGSVIIEERDSILFCINTLVLLEIPPFRVKMFYIEEDILDMEFTNNFEYVLFYLTIEHQSNFYPLRVFPFHPYIFLPSEAGL